MTGCKSLDTATAAARNNLYLDVSEHRVSNILCSPFQPTGIVGHQQVATAASRDELNWNDDPSYGLLDTSSHLPLPPMELHAIHKSPAVTTNFR